MTRNLLAEEFRSQMTVEKSCFHIRGHDFKVIRNCESKDNLNTRHLRHRCIRLIKVLRALTKALCNKPSFLLAADNRTIRVILKGKNPTDTNSLATRW